MSIYSKFIRGVLVPLDAWRSGDSSRLRYLREFERTQYLPPEELAELQLQRLKRIVDHAYSSCPFYREQFDRAGLIPSDIQSLADVTAIPFLEKSQIQTDFERMVSTNYRRDALIRNRTGGSTGAPLQLYVSPERLRSRWAATIRHNRWAGWDLADKAAIIWGAPQDQPPTRLSSRIRAALLEPAIMLDTSNVTEAKLDAFNEALKRFRPKVFLAYAQAVGVLARYLRSRGRDAYQPQAIVTSAEVLDPSTREVVESVFGCRVFNRYGCREVSVIASECSAHAGMHVMSEGLLVEVVRGGKAVSAGELGEVVITDLFNDAMPLIRYRIQDTSAWMTESCSCGRTLPRLREVAGRVTDFLVGCGGQLVSGAFLSLYLVGDRASLGQVQIVQSRQGQVHFVIKPGTGFRESDDLEYVRATARRYLGAETECTFEFVAEIPHLPSGKYAFSRSDIVPDFLRQPDSQAPVSRGQAAECRTQ